MDARRNLLPNINFITGSKAELYTHAPKIDPSPTFHKINQEWQCIIVFMDHRRTYMPVFMPYHVLKLI